MFLRMKWLYFYHLTFQWSTMMKNWTLWCCQIAFGILTMKYSVRAKTRISLITYFYFHHDVWPRGRRGREPEVMHLFVFLHFCFLVKAISKEADPLKKLVGKKQAANVSFLSLQVLLGHISWFKRVLRRKKLIWTSNFKNLEWLCTVAILKRALREVSLRWCNESSHWKIESWRQKTTRGHLTIKPLERVVCSRKRILSILQQEPTVSDTEGTSPGIAKERMCLGVWEVLISCTGVLHCEAGQRSVIFLLIYTWNYRYLLQ